MRAKRHLCRAFVLTCAASFACTGGVLAQDAGPYKIRVETDQVIVPTLVFEKKPGEPSFYQWQDEAGRTLVPNLTATDFHLFEDGSEQKIQGVAVAPSGDRMVPDNKDCHFEKFTTPETRWISGRYPHNYCPPALTGNYYELAYSPPPAAPGSCHRVAVMVDRPKAVADSRTEYCRTPYSASDDLNATPVGRWMEDHLTSEKPCELPLSLQVGILYPRSEPARVHVALELPPAPGRPYWKNGLLWDWYRVLGLVHKKGGDLAWRFSESSDFSVFPPVGVPRGEEAREFYSVMIRFFPYRYETQFHLPPGAYDIGIAFSEGGKFGCAWMPFEVDSQDPKGLGISSVMLGHRYQRAPAAPPAAAGRPAGGRPVLPQGFVPLVGRDIEVTPSGSTRFKHGKPLIAYFEVYEPTPANGDAPSVQIHMNIVDARSGEVEDAFQAVDAAPYRIAGSTVIPIEREIPTKKLKLGSYRLEVQATDSTGRSTIVRAASFTIE